MIGLLSANSGVLLSAIACVTALFFAILRGLCSSDPRHPGKRLPSPPSDPILGHARSIPLTYSWLTFSIWFKTYGEIILVKVLGNPMVIINSVTAARAILERKGANFSNRPPMYLHREWLGWKNSLVFMPYGESHRLQRRLVHPFLTPQAVRVHHSTLYPLIERVVLRLMDAPSKFRNHIHEYTSTGVVIATYGYEPTNAMDPRMLLVEEVSRMATAFDVTVLMLVDLLPFVRSLPTWLPGMHFKKRAIDSSAQRQEMADTFFQFVVESKAAGNAKPSLMSQILDTVVRSDEISVKSMDPALRADLENIGAIMYVAGVDTTDAVIATFILAMAMHPQFAARAQAELDAVNSDYRGGSIVVPSFDDRAKLPFVECIMREVLRWHPPVPLGVPHMSDNADEYLGMFIPRMCTIIPNIWHMCHDENIFSDPYSFNPDRFLCEDATVRQNDPVVIDRADDPKTIVFGFGRRKCPGEHFADATVWLAIATILANFDILPPLDPVTGEPVILEEKFTPNSTSHPEEFTCRFLPRRRN